MKVYIVAKPEDEMEMFIPVYITTHKEKAIRFWQGYTDESIGLVIFMKEWTPESNNICFCWYDSFECKEDTMEKGNTLYKIYNKVFDLDEEILTLYLSGDPDEEPSYFGENNKYFTWNPRIWDLDDEELNK